MEDYIYSIKCKANGKRYIGRSIRPKVRMKNHVSLLKNHRHPVKMLQSDFDMYGEDGFDFTVIAENTGGKTGRGGNEEYSYMRKYKTYDERYGYNYSDMAMYHERKLNGLPVRESNRKKR